MLKVTIENGELVVRAPISENPEPSSTGKTLVVASSRGNYKSDAMIQGQQVIIGLNAYIYPPGSEPRGKFGGR
jgi:hypothetical protein